MRHSLNADRSVDYERFEEDDWIRLVGMKQIRKALKEAGDDLSDMKDIHKQAAKIAVGGAKALAPVRSGKLRDSIRPGGTATSAIVRAGSKRIPYAHAIQWGRRVWPSKEGPAPRAPRKKVNAMIRPSLFLTAGAKETEPMWFALYEKEVEKQLEKIESSPQ